MNSMFSLMDLMIAACGLYVLYTWYLLKYKGEVKETILLPKDLPLKKCKDKAGYMAEISPKVLIYGICVTICGAMGILEDVYHMFGNIYIVALVVFAVATVWFIIQIKKVTKKYWP